jgi:hypothetical protein
MLQPAAKLISEPISPKEVNIYNSYTEWENADDWVVALVGHNNEGQARDMVLDA